MAPKSIATPPNAPSSNPTTDPFASLTSQASTPSSKPPSTQPTTTGDDEEWSFASALPETLPLSNTIRVTQTSIEVQLDVTRDSSSQALQMKLCFSNCTDTEISELTFQTAVSKVSRCCVDLALELAIIFD